MCSYICSSWCTKCSSLKDFQFFLIGLSHFFWVQSRLLNKILKVCKTLTLSIGIIVNFFVPLELPLCMIWSKLSCSNIQLCTYLSHHHFVHTLCRRLRDCLDCNHTQPHYLWRHQTSVVMVLLATAVARMQSVKCCVRHK